MLLAFDDNAAERGLRRSEGRISSVATADDKVILAGWRQIVETTVDDLYVALQHPPLPELNTRMTRV